MNALLKTLALIAFAHGVPAAAEVGGSVTAHGGAADAYMCSDANSTGALISTSCGNSQGGLEATSSASFFAAGGHLAAFADARASKNYFISPTGQPVAHAGASAFVSDQVTISSVGQSGAGTLIFDLYLARTTSDSLSASPIPSFVQTAAYGTTFVLGAAVVNGNQIIHQQRDEFSFVYNPNDGSSTRYHNSLATINGAPVDTALGLFRYMVPFNFDSPFYISLELGATVSASADTNAAAQLGLDATRSLDWGGISGVMFEGQAVAYTITSTSGVDWSQSFIPAVPELSTALSLAVGLPVLFARARRGRRWP